MPNGISIAASFSFGAIGFLFLQGMHSLSVWLSFGRRSHWLKFPIMVKIKPRPSLAVVIRFCFDLLSMLALFLMITLLDCAILGGKTTMAEILCICIGALSAYSAYRYLIRNPLACICNITLDLLSLFIGILLYPFSGIFRWFVGIYRRILLICIRKCAIIIHNKKVKRYSKHQSNAALVAFLPNGIFDAIGMSCEQEGQRYG